MITEQTLPVMVATSKALTTALKGLGLYDGLNTENVPRRCTRAVHKYLRMHGYNPDKVNLITEYDRDTFCVFALQGGKAVSPLFSVRVCEYLSLN